MAVAINIQKALYPAVVDEVEKVSKRTRRSMTQVAVLAIEQGLGLADNKEALQGKKDEING